MRRGAGLNDREREMWVQNDEGLYNWFRSSRLSMREFLRQNRAEIDAAIKGVLGPQEPSPRMSRRELELHRAKHWTTSMNPARDPYAYRKPRGLPVMSEVAYVYGPKNIIFWRGTGWLNSDQARGIAQWIDANSGYGSDLYNVVIGLRMHFDAVGGLKFKFAREYSPTLYVKIGGGKNRAYWTNKMLQHIHSLRITKADEIDIVSASRKGGPVKWSDGQVIRLWWD